MRVELDLHRAEVKGYPGRNLSWNLVGEGRPRVSKANLLRRGRAVRRAIGDGLQGEASSTQNPKPGRRNHGSNGQPVQRLPLEAGRREEVEVEATEGNRP